MRKLWLAAAALSMLFSGCGYHVAGHANVVPKTVKSIAIPAFGNDTQRYKLADQLHRAVTREFIERTRYRIVAEPDGADAVLEGSLLNYSANPTVFDQATSRASGVQTVVTVAITLRERATGKVIYQRPSWEIRERYEIATDPRAYLDESETALERVSRDVARAVVSGVLSSF